MNHPLFVGWVSEERALPNNNRWVTACGLTQPTKKNRGGGVKTPRHDHLPWAFIHTPRALRCMYKSIAIKCASRPNRQSAVGWVSEERALPNNNRWVTACGLTQPTKKNRGGGVKTPRHDHLPWAFIHTPRTLRCMYKSIAIGCALAHRQKNGSLPPPQPSPTGEGVCPLEMVRQGAPYGGSLPHRQSAVGWVSAQRVTQHCRLLGYGFA